MKLIHFSLMQKVKPKRYLTQFRRNKSTEVAPKKTEHMCNRVDEIYSIESKWTAVKIRPLVYGKEEEKIRQGTTWLNPPELIRSMSCRRLRCFILSVLPLLKGLFIVTHHAVFTLTFMAPTWTTLVFLYSDIGSYFDFLWSHIWRSLVLVYWLTLQSTVVESANESSFGIGIQISFRIP